MTAEVKEALEAALQAMDVSWRLHIEQQAMLCELNKRLALLSAKLDAPPYVTERRSP